MEGKGQGKQGSFHLCGVSTLQPGRVHAQMNERTNERNETVSRLDSPPPNLRYTSNMFVSMYTHTKYSFVLVREVCTKAAQAMASGALAMVACIYFGAARACLGATRAQPLQPDGGTEKLVSTEFRTLNATRQPKDTRNATREPHKACTGRQCAPERSRCNTK